MSYIGKEPIVGNFQVCDAISVVNGQAAYTMQVSSTNVVPESANHMLVSLNGILQKPNSSFTVSGSTITFASALATGDVIDFIMLLGNVLDLGVPSDATVTDAKANFVSTSSAAGLQIKGDGTTDGTLQLNCSQNSHGIKLKSPAHSTSSSYTLTFPGTDPSADKFLKTDGSGNLSFADAGGGQYTEISRQTVNVGSAVSAVTFTSSHFTSTYDDYLLVLTLNNETDDVRPTLRFSDDNGSTYESGIDQVAISVNSDNTTHVEVSGSTSSVSLAGRGLDNTASRYHAFTVQIFNPLSSVRGLAVFGHGVGKIASSSGNNFAVQKFAAGEASSTIKQYNNMKIEFNSGNIDAGTFILYGRNK